MRIKLSAKIIFLFIIILGFIFAANFYQEPQTKLNMESAQQDVIGSNKLTKKINQQQTYSSTPQSQPKVVDRTSQQSKQDIYAEEGFDSDLTATEQEDSWSTDHSELASHEKTEIDKSNFEDIQTPKIRVSGEKNELYFIPESELDYQAIEVVISLPNGKQLRTSFDANEPVAIFDKNLKDGSYVWETNVTPKITPAIRKEMAAVRALGNLKEEQKLINELREDGHIPSAKQAKSNVQSGHFRILDGKLVMQDDNEKPFRNEK